MSEDRRAFLRGLAERAARAGGAASTPTEPASVGPSDGPRADASALAADERERYAGQLALLGWGEAGQLAVRGARVLVVGAGALGSPVAAYLAAAGVGRLGIVDDEDVELPDLHRQHLHFTPDLGAPKAESAAAKLRFLNPAAVIEPYRARLEPANAPALVEGQDLVVDCSNAPATRAVVNAACCTARVPLVEAGATGLTGFVMAVRPGESACYRCALPTPPAAPGPGSLGPAAGVVGSLQALEALKLLAGLGPPLLDAVVHLDLAAPALVRTAVRRRPDCPDCGGPDHR